MFEKLVKLSELQQFNGEYGEIYFTLIVVIVAICITFIFVAIVKGVVEIWKRTCTTAEVKSQQVTEQTRIKKQR